MDTRLQVLVSEDMKLELTKQAKALGLSLSSYIRMVLNNELTKKM